MWPKLMGNVTRGLETLIFRNREAGGGLNASPNTRAPGDTQAAGRVSGPLSPRGVWLDWRGVR